MVLNNQWVTENIKEEIKKYRETNENKHINPKSAGCSKNSSKREVYSDKSLPQEVRKVLNNLTWLKGMRKKQAKPSVTKWKKVIMIRVKRNKID